MGDLSKKIARVDVLIGGVDVAQHEVEKMKAKVKELRVEMEKAEQAMHKATDTIFYDDKAKAFDAAKKEHDKYNKALQETQRNVKTVKQYLTDISGQTLRNLSQAKKALEQMLRGIDPRNVKGLETVRGFIKQLGDEIKRRKGDLKEFKDVFSEIGKVSDSDLSKARTRLEELIATTKKSEAELASYKARLNLVRAEERKRMDMASSKVLGNLQGSSVTEIKEAIKATEQLRDAQTRGSQEWDVYNKRILTANDYLESFKKNALRDDMLDRFHRLGQATASSLSEQKKYWQEMAEGVKFNTSALNVYLDKVKAIEAEEQRRQSKGADKVMSNLSSSSVAEIREAIKVTEQLRDAQIRGSQEWEYYTLQLKDANKYLEDYSKADKWQRMEEGFRDLSKLSNASFEDQKKYWQEMADGAERGSKELADYRLHLAKIQEEENNRKKDRVRGLLSDIGNRSDGEIKEAIKLMTELRDATSRTDAAWGMYSRDIKKATEYLNRYEKTQKELQMGNTLLNLGDASKSALEEAKKYWQEMADGVAQTDPKLQIYKKNLQDIYAEEKKRANLAAQQTLSKVKGGSFRGSIGETEEAVKQLKQLRQTLSTDDAAGIKEIDDAIEKLNTELGKTKEQLMGVDEALQKADDYSKGQFHGTFEELERVKKSLIEAKKHLDVSDKDGIEAINKAMEQLGDTTEKTKMDLKEAKSLVEDRLDTASMNELKKAAAALQQELEESAANEKDFIENSARLRQVNTRIREVNRSWEAHDNQIMATVKRLTSYVAVYGGFNFIKDRIADAIRKNSELSDSLANIRKTTGMTRQAVAELSLEIDKIDTRTSQKELHDLAYEAGKLGLKAQEDVLGFVKAGNQLIASLGEDLGGPEAVRTLMKINDLLGETKKLGVEKALLATGSAINELSQNSTASAGPIADIVARLGAVGAQSRLTMADLIALGGTADELSQDAEVVGTAVSKFVTSLQTNTHSIAQAIDVDDEELNRLMESGQMMEAILTVLERMKKMGLKQIAPIMKEFGSDGDRLNRVVNALSGNVDTLRKRVEMSNEAFKEAKSVTTEYAILNDSTAAIWERWLNKFNEMFVNSTNEGLLRKLVQTLYKFTAWVENNKSTVKWIVLSISTITLYLKLQSKAWQKNMSACLTSVSAMKKSVSDFGKSIKLNWVAVVLTATAAIVSYFTMFKENAKSAISMAGKFSEELNREHMRLEKLFHDLKEATGQKEKYSSVLNEINTRYGSYLGFQLTELDNASKLAAAQKLINSRLSEGIALRLKAKMNAESEEKYGSLITSSTVGMNEILADKGYAEDSARVIGAVHDVVNENMEKSVEELITLSRRAVSKTLTDIYGGAEVAFSGVADKMHSDIRQYVEARKNFAKELKQTDDFVNSQITYSHKKTVQDSLAVMDEISKEYKQHQAELSKATTEKEKKEINDELVRNAEQYLSMAKKMKEEKPDALDADKWKELNDSVKVYEDSILNIRGVLNEPTIWGKGMSLEKASVDQLVAKYKELFEERKTIKDDADYTKVYGAKFRDRKAAFDWFMEQLKIVEKRLNEMGYDKNGNFLKEKNPRKGKTDARDKVNAYMAALEAYYNKEQQFITRSYIEKELTEEEYRRRSLDNEEHFLLDRIALREKLLGRKGGADFDQSKYKHTDSETGEVTEYFKGKDIESLIKFINKIGDTLKDGILKELTEDELKLYGQSVDHIKKIQQILLDNNFTGQIDKQYQEELERLDLFWGFTEARTEESGKKKLELMREFAKESYDMTTADMISKMMSHEEFSEWIHNRSSKDYDALLLLLRKYYDDYALAEKKEMERRQKVADQDWKSSGREGYWNDMEDADEWNASLAKGLNEIGILDDRSTEDVEIAMYEHKLQAAQEYYEQVERMGGDLQKAREERNEAYMALENAEMESTKRKLGILSNYTDAVVEFGTQMGEAAFGEVEDRKAAAKQLLRTTMELTKNLIVEQIKRLIFKKQMSAAEIATEQATGAATTAIHGTQAVSDLTVEGAKTVATTEMGIAQGSAKTIGKLGWWGIPLIAVITAALSALMGLAMGKMSKAKKEVQAATGVGATKSRIAAGMLTYASGDYPILGNDGKVYNATYHDKLQTGVYSGGNGKAHFGLFSEKKPEMIVDGDTTQKIMLDYPALYESILTIANHGRLQSASVPTFAAGSYPAPSDGISSFGTSEMMATLESLNAAVDQLQNRLKRPIVAEVNPYGSKGAVRQMSKAEKFMRQTGQI